MDGFNPQARESLILLQRVWVIFDYPFQSAGSREPDQQTFTNSKHLHITFLLQSTKYHNIFHLFIQTILQLTLKSRCEPPTEFMFT